MKAPIRYLALATALAAAAVIGHAEIVDQILATVDTEVILQSDVMAELSPYLNQLRQEAASEEEFNRAAQQRLRATLEQQIDSKILLREALLADVQIDEDRVEKELERFRKLYPSNEEFLQDLRDAGETVSDLREQIRKRGMATVMGDIKRTQFEREAVISESEVAQYYQDHKDEFSRPERVRCRQIFLVAGPDEDERAKARARLEALCEELEAGADFAKLAAAHSQAPGAEDGGIIGWVVRKDLVPALDEVAFTLPPGECSGILETDGGVHILMVDEKEEAGLASLDEVRTEIEPLLRAKAADERYDKWIKELRKRSRVRIFI